MRDIRFRAWDKKQEFMFNKIDMEEIADNFDDGCSMLFRVIKKLKDYNEMEFPSTINNGWKDIVWMQFTGLQDSKGKDIYEGDIVHYKWVSDLDSSQKVERYYKVGFHHGAFKQTDIHNLNGDEQYDIWEIWSNLEVIGNIHENPELIK